ncbi:MHYT domain-containing protein [Saccharopolyspora flava]|uniref:MHYT domain-containing protein, NO-binding membrane sensor n=1 Tax=Saccharopolyspora flava TaxID=95161 RepID=A0A1I6V3A5_9PSEU|nr:MHYT domain-containing protein [Saccharopolyspora flava]SFT08047.1 MHYT domain-containing protein, NO-binding membrane sensor [Saccharopolyspora flava]
MGPLGSTTEFGFGWLTPVLSFVMACVGAGLGLRCMVRALGTTGRARRSWLINGAFAIGTGIWTMHFIAMLGFSVVGTDIRYDVPLTVLSLVVAIIVVGIGVFVVSYSRSKTPAVLGGGVITGLGVAVMHYVGMAAMRMSGSISYAPLTVALSVLIAVVAATAALWATLTVTGPVAAFGASVVMGIAVSLMHYTGMSAVNVHLHSGAHSMHSELPGATPMAFIFPLTVLLGTYLFLSSAFVAISPNVRSGKTTARAPEERQTVSG